MFKVDDIVGMYFRYTTDEKTGRRQTHCHIVDDTEEELSHGVAECSKEDQFDKAVGRRLALARAVEPFTKAERREVWSAYYRYMKR